MKNKCCCPKCNSDEILRDQGANQGYGYGNNLQLSMFKQVIVTRYVCCNCGFIENWVDYPSDLVKVRDHYLKRNKQLTATNRKNSLIR
jgi:predicted nucleic-acid-binding Zn-ribbon protein